MCGEVKGQEGKTVVGVNGILLDAARHTPYAARRSHRSRMGLREFWIGAVGASRTTGMGGRVNLNCIKNSLCLVRLGVSNYRR
jgi:hypothetical protein